MKDWILNRPWIWVVLTFVLLTIGWVAVLMLARANLPQPIPLERGHE